MSDLCVYLDGMKPNIYNQEYRVRNLESIVTLFILGWDIPKSDSVLVHPTNQWVIVYGDILKDLVMLNWGLAQS